MTKANCSICTNEKSLFFLGHRQLCFRCDELLIDLEMEIEEAAIPHNAPAYVEAGATAEEAKRNGPFDT